MSRKKSNKTAAVAIPVVMAVLIGLGYFGLQNLDLDVDLDLDTLTNSEQKPDPVVNADYESDADVLDLIASLEIAEPNPGLPYDRDAFAEWGNASDYGWDEQYAGCDTKWATRARDAVNLVWFDQESCIIETGMDATYWIDSYGSLDDSGALTYYTSEDPSTFDIDHIVSLGDAWRSGAWEMDQATRDAISNDSGNLIVADAGQNRSKSDQGPADWLPIGEGFCNYIEQYVTVKAKYGLTVTQQDFDALLEGAQACS